MVVMITRILLSLCLFFTWANAESIKSTTGNIIFDINNDGTSEAKLTSDGLAIGAGLSPSSNLHVQGNVINTGDLVVGGTAGNSTLEIQGTVGYNTQTISSNTTLSGNSVILVDTSSDNVTLTLPYAGNVTGRLYTIKKTSVSNEITLNGGGNNIDSVSSYSFNSGNVSYIHVVSNGVQWWSIGKSATGVDAINVVTIYSDDFSGGASSILGVAPDVAPGAEAWVGYGTTFYANGSRVPGAHSAYLPFTPVAGKIYTLSANVHGSGGWTYFGFCSDDPDGQNVRHDTLGSYGSILYYDPSSNDNLITYYGEDENGNLTINDVCVNGPNVLKVVLDATDANSANWTMEFILNGTSIRAAATATTGDYGNIGYFGFNNVAGGGTGTVTSILLQSNNP